MRGDSSSDGRQAPLHGSIVGLGGGGSVEQCRQLRMLYMCVCLYKVYMWVLWLSQCDTADCQAVQNVPGEKTTVH